MLLSVLFFKLSLENFLSQQRETRSHRVLQRFFLPRSRAGWELRDRVCEWPSAQYRVTIRLIDENRHCLCSWSQRNCCTKGFLSWSPTSLLCQAYSHKYHKQVKFLESSFKFVMIQQRIMSLSGCWETFYWRIVLIILPVFPEIKTLAQ